MHTARYHSDPLHSKQLFCKRVIAYDLVFITDNTANALHMELFKFFRQLFKPTYIALIPECGNNLLRLQARIDKQKRLIIFRGNNRRKKSAEACSDYHADFFGSTNIEQPVQDNLGVINVVIYLR